MKRALGAWMDAAARGADAQACMRQALMLEDDPWTLCPALVRLATAEIRTAPTPIGLTAALQVRNATGAGIIARVAPGRPYPEGGEPPPVDRAEALRWVDAGRSVGQTAPIAVLLLDAAGGMLPLAAQAWGIPRVVVVERRPAIRLLIERFVPEAVVVDEPSGIWPCVIARADQLDVVRRHAAPGAGVGLRVDGEPDEGTEAWLARQWVRGRTRTADGWLLGVVVAGEAQ